MIHVQVRDTDANVGYDVGSHENAASLSGLSVPKGYCVQLVSGEWKSWMFYEGIYDLSLYATQERPERIVVMRAAIAPMVTVGVAKYVLRDALGNLKSVASTKQGKPPKQYNETLTTEYAYYKLPLRERAYIGFDDFPDNDVDTIDIPDGLTVHVFHHVHDPEDVYKWEEKPYKKVNPHREYTGFVDMRARSMGNHISAIRVIETDALAQEKADAEEARIQGTILSMMPNVHDHEGAARVRIMSYATSEHDFGKIEEDWQKWMRSNEDAGKGLMLSCRHGVPIAGWIVNATRKIFYHGSKPNVKHGDYHPAILIEKMDGERVEVSGYDKVVYHQVEPLRGIYYLDDWIEWRKGDRQVFAIDIVEVKRLWKA